MRIDLFLKTSRLIKRRKLANDACVKGLVLVNEFVAKPSLQVKLGDLITLNLARKQIIVKVSSLTPLRNDLMYELISENYLDWELGCKLQPSFLIDSFLFYFML